MKKILTLGCILLGVGVLIQGCHKEKPLDHSDCKTFGSKSGLQTIGPDTSCLCYSYDQQKKELKLNHINAGFNCCPGELYCDIEIRDDIIFLKEKEKEAGCDCNCLFDIDIMVTDVEKQAYFISLVEPYALTQQKIAFAIDLAQQPSGCYCVPRTDYPWGL